MTTKAMYSLLFLSIFWTSCNAPDSKGSTRKPGQESIATAEVPAAPETNFPKFLGAEGGMQIDGEVGNVAYNNRYVKLFETEGRDFFVMDSTLVEDGKFQFQLARVEPGIFKIGMDAEANRLGDIVLNPAEAQIALNYSSGSFRNAPNQTDSKETQAWQEYLNTKRLYDNDIDGIRKSAGNGETKRNSIYQRDLVLRKDQILIAEKYPDTFVANVMYHLQSANRFDKNGYWKDMDFKDVSLVHSSVYPDRIEDYMRVHASAQRAENEPLLGFYNAVDQIAQKIKDAGSDRVLEFALYTMSEGFYSSGMEEMSLYVVDNYFYGDACGDAEISELFKMKAAGIRNLKVGNSPPDFTLTSSTGKSLSLGQIAKSKDFTLVLFWASFCHKCEREIPELQKIYSQYKSKGFEVLAVSVDTDKSAWVNGIKTHATIWPNASDLQGWRSPVAKDFRVTSTPVMFLVNKNREIVAKPKNTQELATFLASAK